MGCLLKPQLDICDAVKGEIGKLTKIKYQLTFKFFRIYSNGFITDSVNIESEVNWNSMWDIENK